MPSLNTWFVLFVGSLVAIKANAKTIAVEWTVFQPYDDIEANVGDTIEFSFGDIHDLWLHPSGSCDTTGSTELGGSVSPVSYTITAEHGGSTLTFACQEPGHCDQGSQILNVIVAPVTPSGSLQCFSAANTVEVQNRGMVPIQELRIGDSVRTNHPKKAAFYSKVYSFGHFDETAEADFVQLTFTDATSLELTANHMVWVNETFLPALQLGVGDVVNSNKVVEEISVVKRVGLYAPFTEDGTIVVSGVVSSCYSVVLPNAVGSLFLGGWNHHFLAHGAVAPFRWQCQLGLCRETETYTDGISDRYRALLPIASFLLGGDKIIQTVAVYCVFLPLSVVALAIECLLRYLVEAVLIISVASAFFHRTRRTKFGIKKEQYMVK